MWLLKGILYILLGLLAIIIGLAIVAWVLYNIFIETLPGYTGPKNILNLGSLGISVSMVGFGIIWLKRGYLYLTN